MRKTAYLLLMMMLFLGFSGSILEPSSSSAPPVSLVDKVVAYEKFLEYRELDYRVGVEERLYDSLASKPSLKWLLTGFIDRQIHFESGGNQSAISPEGAQGIAQFMPDTWNSMLEKGWIPAWFDINNEAHQRIAQLVYLDHLNNMWYSMPQDRKALVAASYNAGPGKVQEIVNMYGSMWREYLPQETIKYLHNLKFYL
jgi:hypothetical protein